MKLSALRLAALVPLAVLLSACGAVVLGAPNPPLTLHQRDFGHSYSIHAGDSVRLELVDTFPVPGSSVVWNADSADPSILTRVAATRGTPSSIANSKAGYVVVFKAIKSGQATIEAVGTASCEAMNPAFCPQPSGSIAITIS
ncbi:MAG: hypothetical protein PVSMB9_02650 [Candidatus Dormibacteria bacterium]